MIKKAISICVSIVFLLNISIFSVNAAGEGDTLVEERFDCTEVEEGNDIGGWNGWNEECADLTKYTLDSKYSLTRLGEEKNGAASFYRSACSNQSAAFMSTKTLTEPVYGGKVSISMSIKRTNYAAKLFLLRFYDSGNHMMGFVIDLASSRIYAENGGTFPNFYFPDITKNTQSPLDTWQKLQFVIDFENLEFDCLYAMDNAEMSTIAKSYPIVSTNNGSIEKISVGTQRNANLAGAQFYVDDLTVKVAQAAITDEEACTANAEEFREKLSSPLNGHVDLSTSGSYKTVIDWKSSDENIITSKGKITQLYKQEQHACLTATFSRGDYSMTKSYDIVIAGLDEYLPPSAEIMQAVADGLDFSEISDESINAITSDLNLINTYDKLQASAIGGTNLTWTSSEPGLVSDNGLVKRTTETSNVVLTAHLTAKRDDSLKSEKQFILTLLPAGNVYLNESFDKPQSNEGQDIDGWNGWSTVYGDETVYRMDSYFTVCSETGSERNKVVSFFRPTCDSSSMYVTTKKKLENTIDGGTVNLRFRINRKNSSAKVFLLQFTDNGSHTMEFVVDLAASRIYSGGMNTPTFPTFYFPGIKVNTQLPIDEWLEIELVLKLDEQKFDCYCKNSLIAENYPMISSNNGTIDSITLATNRTANTGGNALFYVDDISLVQTSPKISDEEACKLVCEMLKNKYSDYEIYQDIRFETDGKYKTTIVWNCDDCEVAKIRKNVMSVTRKDTDRQQIINVSVYRNNTERKIEIPVVIKALDEVSEPTQEAVSIFAENFDFSEVSNENPFMVTQPLNLMKTYFSGNAAAFGGVDVSWASSRPYVINEDGGVVQYQYDTSVELTATFSSIKNPELKASKKFNITVLSEGETVFKEDFENADITDMNKTIEYDGWSLSRGDLTHIPAADAKIEFDNSSSGNKLLHMTRTVKNSSVPPYAAYQLVQKEFDKEITDGILVFSMRFMITNSTSRVSMIIHDSYGSSPGTSIQISQYYAGGKKLEQPIVLNKWYTASIVFQMDKSGSGSHTYDLFVDQKKVCGDKFKSTNNYPLTAFSIYSERNSDGPNASWFVDDILIRRSEMNYKRDVENAYDALNIDESELASGKLSLGCTGLFGTGIKWLSSEPNIISPAGLVYRSDKSVDVRLTAIISRGNITKRKTFDVTIPADTGLGTDYTISSLNISGEAVTAADIYKNTETENAVLVLLQYERGTLKTARTIPLPNENSSSLHTVFEPIELLTEGQSYIKAYVWNINKNSIVSNVIYR